MTTAQKYQLNQDLLKSEFGKRYQEWNDPRPMDDRCIYCNIYEICMKICEDMKTVENVHIRCAVDNLLHDYENTMRRIISNF